MIPFNLMMVLMFFNMSVACHSMGVSWAMVIKPLNNTEKQPKLKYLRPEDNRPHWSADGETGMQRILNEDGSDVHHDPAKDMIGGNSPASLRFRDPIEAALEEIEIDRKNVPKYIPVGAYSEEIFEKTSSWDYVNFHQNTQLRDK